jgi:hypothetical protein
MRADPNAINCHCRLPAVARASTAETNRGRKFWGCGSSDEDCSFFQWVDTPPNRQVAGSDNRAAGTGTFGSGKLGGGFEDDSGYGGSGWSDSGKAVPTKRRVSSLVGWLHNG